MKTGIFSFRLTWEDLDNFKYIQYYFAERRYTRTDVLRMLLREARKELEAEVGVLRNPYDRDYGSDLCEDSGAIYSSPYSSVRSAEDFDERCPEYTDEDPDLPL